ncbi:MAG: nucleotide sugar dehydrogenase [Nitrospinae bacterium]|nr:nucleotide sugar dehydrogenase [Nitrospinota bacterium]
MFTDLLSKIRNGQAPIAVIGLGYVGLPLAVAFAKKFRVIGFDNNPRRLERLMAGHDDTGEVESARLTSGNITFTGDPSKLKEARFIAVTVPTPVDGDKRPDLSPLISASASIGRHIAPGTVVVYESTVYPGVTEDVCVPVIEKESGLERGVDFKVGYSPERINPGDKEHTIERVTKVVSGEDATTLDIVAGVYGDVITAGVHKAQSVKVAEAAKVIENIQRDINIALANELSMIFNLMGIRTKDVLAAAGTKWNFIKYSPGLVGGHCIGVDPYYLTTKAEQLGYHPQMILSGRRINDGMGKYVAEQAVKRLIKSGKQILGAKVGILGLTFKENVPDLRNSRVPDIYREFVEFGLDVKVHDPVCDPKMAHEEYGIHLCGQEGLKGLDMVVLAVPHKEFLSAGPAWIKGMFSDGKGVMVDVKSVMEKCDFTPGADYWSL